jgi:DNA-binding CsgD family transcriptional regulator
MERYLSIIDDLHAGTRNGGPFDTQDQGQLRSLAPHVSRALEIRDRLEATNVRADAAELGISPREAELAALLAGGLGLRRIAQRLRISVHTARTHLKAIYGKTGIGSQAELVQRIGAGAAAHEGRDGGGTT